jgi:hypothetical protein
MNIGGDATLKQSKQETTGNLNKQTGGEAMEYRKQEEKQHKSKKSDRRTIKKNSL